MNKKNNKLQKKTSIRLLGDIAEPLFLAQLKDEREDVDFSKNKKILAENQQQDSQ